MKDLVRFAGLAVLVAAAAWIAVGELDIPEEAKRTIRARILQALAGFLSVGLLVLGAASLPAWGAFTAAGAAAVAAAGVPHLIESGALDGLTDPTGTASSGSGEGGALKCGDPGTCGMVIDGVLCLGNNC